MVVMCSSCNKRVTNDIGTVSFVCPNCAKSTIVRCSHCRKIATRYTCPACGFSGPN